MKTTKLRPFHLLAGLIAALCLAYAIAGCSTPQLEASGAFIAAEVATAQILQKHPEQLPTITLLVVDFNKYKGGTLTATDEAVLLQTIVTNTKQKLTPVQAALLDGATQQMLANTNATAPTAIGGAAMAILTDVMNGVARELVVYSTPPAS